jgi:hypothetical protein
LGEATLGWPAKNIGQSASSDSSSPTPGCVGDETGVARFAAVAGVAVALAETDVRALGVAVGLAETDAHGLGVTATLAQAEARGPAVSVSTGTAGDGGEVGIFDRAGGKAGVAEDV